VGVQILGSGGPIAESDRAGSSAIVWIDGKAAILVDVGSGAFLRYAQSGARFEDHRVIALTHFHADHVADLVAVLNSGGFSDRTEPLTIMGPKGSADFPGLSEHLQALFNPQSGAFSYLSGYLDGSSGKVRLVPIEVSSDAVPEPMVDSKTGARITAIPVEHGVVPALAYLIEVQGKSIVFAGDQNEFSDGFVTFLKNRNPDLLIVHNVIPEGPGQPRGLHRPPMQLGAMAAVINPKLLVLSHNMKRALDRQAEGEAAIRKSYKGPMRLAGDLDCYSLT
jgi:ribonuclease BN (tRNA processing enzyme)